MSNINGFNTYENDQTTSDQVIQPFLEFNASALDRIAESFVPLCDAAQPRTRKRRERDLIDFSLVLATVIANAFRRNDHPTRNHVHYSRGADTYSNDELYSPAFFRHDNLLKAVDGLAAVGLLESNVPAPRRSSFKVKGAKQSTFAATPKLIAQLAAIGVLRDDIQHSPERPVVILKDADKRVVRYDPRETCVASMISTIRSYNAQIEGVKLELGITEDQISAMHTERATEKGPPINFDAVFLRRIFNNGTWNDGGRWFGGWWQTIPSKWRPYILIDGAPTVELDYSGFLTRAIYHAEGKDNRDEDIYYIKEIADAAENQGLSWESVRGSVKLLQNVLINASPADRIGRISGLTLPKGYKQPNKVYPLIQARHPEIGHQLRTGIGLQIMRKESDICEAIVTEGVSQGIAVLPIHDSYIVQEKNRGWLREIMLSSYRDEFGFDAIINDEESIEEKKEGVNSVVEYQQTEVPVRGHSIKSLIGECVMETHVDDWAETINGNYLIETDGYEPKRRGGEVRRAKDLFDTILSSNRS